VLDETTGMFRLAWRMEASNVMPMTIAARPDAA
jgi:hypothetical protein